MLWCLYEKIFKKCIACRLMGTVYFCVFVKYTQEQILVHKYFWGNLLEAAIIMQHIAPTENYSACMWNNCNYLTSTITLKLQEMAGKNCKLKINCVLFLCWTISEIKSSKIKKNTSPTGDCQRSPTEFNACKLFNNDYPNYPPIIPSGISEIIKGQGCWRCEEGFKTTCW